MRLRLILVLLLVTSAQAFCQKPAADPSLPKDPRAILDSATPHYDFSDPALKPWHLKARYQLYDLAGKPTEQGTWEYWWASSKVHRSSWTRSGTMCTDWTTNEGTIYRQDTGLALKYFERNLESILLHPLPLNGLVDSGRTKLDVKTVGSGQDSVVCVTASLQWEKDGKLIPPPPSARPQYFCFDTPTMALLMSYSNSLITEYSQIAKIGNQYFARHVEVQIGKQKAFSVSVETLGSIEATDPALSRAVNAVVAHEPVSQPAIGQSGANAKTGSLVKKTQPVYPAMAKAAHEQGVVVLAATIGIDGKIHDLEVLSTPSPLLADSAVNAVKKWEYQPYLLNGQAVEVESIVNVTYSLGN
jgi:TonB family protein